MKPYVVTAGLTRRLIHADDEAGALDQFYAEFPRRRLYAFIEGAVRVHEASAVEIIDFTPPSRTAPRIEGQLELPVNDTRRARRKRKERT